MDDDELRKELDCINREINLLADVVIKLGQRIQRLEGAKISTDKALKVYEALKQSEPDLTLADFAEQYGHSYEALRRMRIRKRKKES